MQQRHHKTPDRGRNLLARPAAERHQSPITTKQLQPVQPKEQRQAAEADARAIQHQSRLVPAAQGPDKLTHKTSRPTPGDILQTRGFG